MTYAPFVSQVECKFESEASRSAERKLQSCIIQGTSPSEGYTTLVRKFENCLSLSHQEE